MFMKILTLALNYLMTKNQAPQQSPGFFAHLTTKTIRKVFMVSAGLVASIVLFLGGFLTVIMDLILTSRDAQGLALSQTSIVGFGLIVLSAATAAYLFSRKVWALPGHEHVHASGPAAPQISPVHDAVAELIRDFTEERRLMRMQMQQQAEMEAAMMAAAAAAEAERTTGPVVGNETFPTTNRPAFN